MGNAAAAEALATMHARVVLQANAKRSRGLPWGTLLAILTILAVLIMTWITSSHPARVWIDSSSSLPPSVDLLLGTPERLVTHFRAPTDVRPPHLEPDVATGTDPPVRLEGTNRDNCEC